MIVAFASNFDFIFVMVVVGLLSSTRVSDIIKNVIATLKKEKFIDAAKELGLSDSKILLKHILKYHCRRILVIQFIMVFMNVVMIEATLSYLNFGVPEPYVSWGKMIYEGLGRKTGTLLEQGYLWMSFPPIFMMILTAIGSLILADALNTRR